MLHNLLPRANLSSNQGRRCGTHYANELPPPPITSPLSLLCCIHYPERQRGAAPLRSVFCVPRPGCGEQSRHPALNNALSFLLLYRWVSSLYSRRIAVGGFGLDSMNAQCYTVAMDLSVCQLRNFSISFLSSVLGTEGVRLDNSSSGASVVAIDNKIEQAMDLVKSHLMYAVREEVEVLKEQIKELIERNAQLEQENNLLKNLASPEQMAQFQAQVQTGSPTGPPGGPLVPLPGGTPLQQIPPTQSSGTSA